MGTSKKPERAQGMCTLGGRRRLAPTATCCSTPPRPRLTHYQPLRERLHSETMGRELWSLPKPSCSASCSVRGRHEVCARIAESCNPTHLACALAGLHTPTLNLHSTLKHPGKTFHSATDIFYYQLYGQSSLKLFIATSSISQSTSRTNNKSPKKRALSI